MHLGGIEALVLVLLIPFGLIPTILVPIFIYRDATERRNPSAAIWCIGGVLAWLVTLIVYLVVRPDFRASTPE